MCIELPFDPFPLFSGSHGQTIIGSCFHWQIEPNSITRFVELPDGDKLALEVTTPNDWDEKGITVVMIHGLCGSHKSAYLIRMTKKLAQKGIRCIRLNLRGCGSGKGHARQIYHSGRSDDVLCALNDLVKDHPNTKFVLLGFSLGGNIVLKLLGEMNSHAKGLIKQVIAISPPIDLYESVKVLHEPPNRFYERYFIRLLKQDVRYRHKIFPDLPKIKFPKEMSFYEFDELYTAPQAGFKNAMDYYEKCSSKPLVPEISIDCKVLFSEDDPIISSSPLEEDILPENISIYKTKKGGHMGYLSVPGKNKSFHWMDQLLLSWILE